jgi:predicted MFS family arabinose efflux permease
VGPLLGGPIVDQYGIRTLLFINVAILLIVVLSLSFGYHDPYRSSHREPILKMAWDSVRIILWNSRLRSVFLALFILFSGWILTFSYVPVIITSIYHGDNPASAIGYIVGGGGFVALILVPLIGSIADRIGFWTVLTFGAGFLSALWIVPYFTRQIILLESCGRSSMELLRQFSQCPSTCLPLLHPLNIVDASCHFLIYLSI